MASVAEHPSGRARRPTRKETQSQRTRAALLATARRLFAARGYAGTSTEDLVRRTGVTRGALYHQFRDKRALFEAVLDRVCEEAWQVGREVSRRRAAERRAGPQSVERHLAALEVLLDGALDPELHRLVLVEAPAVLGSEGLRRLLERHFLARLRGAVAAYQREGRLDPTLPAGLPDLLLGAIVQAARTVADASDPQRARQEMGEAIAWLWRRLEPPASVPGPAEPGS
jgi:AcrR family transcriptional regulator